MSSLQGAMQFSSSDKVMANVTLGADIATLPVARAMKNVLSFASARSVTQGNLLNSVGQTTQAALADVIQQLDTKAANAVQGTRVGIRLKLGLLQSLISMHYVLMPVVIFLITKHYA